MTGISDSSVLSLPQVPSFKQIAFVVRSLKVFAFEFWANFRIGPWTGWTITLAVTRDMHFRGKPGQLTFSHALAWKDGAQCELVQPLAGESLFSEHRKRHGEGWFHLRKYFADITLARARWSGKPSRRFRVRPALS